MLRFPVVISAFKIRLNEKSKSSALLFSQAAENEPRKLLSRLLADEAPHEIVTYHKKRAVKRQHLQFSGSIDHGDKLDFYTEYGTAAQFKKHYNLKSRATKQLNQNDVVIPPRILSRVYLRNNCDHALLLTDTTGKKSIRTVMERRLRIFLEQESTETRPLYGSITFHPDPDIIARLVNNNGISEFRLHPKKSKLGSKFLKDSLPFRKAKVGPDAEFEIIVRPDFENKDTAFAKLRAFANKCSTVLGREKALEDISKDLPFEVEDVGIVLQNAKTRRTYSVNDLAEGAFREFVEVECTNEGIPLADSLLSAYDTVYGHVVTT